ncbi:alpha/beta fold hydrolase [Heyndrickxia sp. NPDC080065]|uniref:alpha/beta fold hydrolase n=1 Tax=Heyndrickxia sp. NPDC080065 TaxID=3390568 RepID=UPI003D07F710
MFIRRTPAIQNAPNSISSLESMTIGGVEQWLLLRGWDQSKPILLWVHGGPGAAQISYIRQFTRELEKEYLVVNWDQRGTGLSFSKNIPNDSMTLNQMVEDLVEIVRKLCLRFSKEKVYILGHSFGAILSFLATSRHPELFYGFFAVSPVISWTENDRVSYEFILKKSQEIGNEKAYAELKRIGPPPWNKLCFDWILTKWLQEFEVGLVHNGKLAGLLFKPILKSTEYRLFDFIRWMRGKFFSTSLLKEELACFDLFKSNKNLQVPIAFCCGRHDFTTPSVLAEAFFKDLQAPVKKWVWFEKSAHSPMFEESEAFNRFILDTANEWSREVNT